MAAWKRPGLASEVTRMTPTAGKRRATSRISSSAGTGPIRSCTTTTSGSSSTDSAARRARVSTSWVESATGATGSASGSWLSSVVRERTASASPTAGRILVGMRLSLVLREFVRPVLLGHGGVAAGGDQREADPLGERLGVGDALGVDGGQGEGDRDGVGGTAAPVVPVGFEGGDPAHVEDLGVGDDDLRLGGVALAFAVEGGVDVHRGAGGDLAGHAGRRVDHDGDLLLSGLEGGLVHDHVGLEQGALAQGGDGDLAADVAEVGDGV